MLPAVAAFTDTYLPTVNGVTYTVQSWRDTWADRGGRMHVVYPDADHVPGPREHPVRSLTFPFYEGFYAALPQIPDGIDDLDDLDVVHAHTPFSLGLAGRRLAGSEALPLVASYHTPTAEYADYIADGRLADVIERVAGAYEKWYLNRADAVVVPSQPACDHLSELGVDAEMAVVPNGVDTDFFAPVPDDELAAFRERHGLPDGPLVGYTGRHGFEKNLDAILDVAPQLDATVVFGGDGPARSRLETRAADLDADVRFLGFLDREELPTFYSVLDVFAFPSPVETQGLVALEANACGTPVVGVNAGALAETVVHGETGFHFPEGDTGGFRDGIERALAAGDTLEETCLARREQISLDHAVDTLADVYDAVL
ncbi:glycosyltransferase [Halorarius litoreus]|uniref:glycosyltransferase n=1 Tax=Halorarius litoreus TaxID=2962676 RepID=UPI0020CD93B4|nr:glycosyltransferase [Halorarius litoreus]